MGLFWRLQLSERKEDSYQTIPQWPLTPAKAYWPRLAVCLRWERGKRRKHIIGVPLERCIISPLHSYWNLGPKELAKLNIFVIKTYCQEHAAKFACVQGPSKFYFMLAMAVFMADSMCHPHRRKENCAVQRMASNLRVLLNSRPVQ